MHSGLTNEIRKRVGDIFSELILDKLDEIDDSFRYAIHICDDEKDFLFRYTSSNIRFMNDIDVVTRETKYNIYDIYNNANRSHPKHGSYTKTFYSNGKARYNRISPLTFDGDKIIFITEKESRELDKIVNLMHTINIYIK